MNDAYSIVQPEPGMIIQIYVRRRHFDFLYGYCRGMLLVGQHVQLLGSFRRRSDPAMTIHWAEAHDFGIQRCDQFSFEMTSEVPWMSVSNSKMFK